MTQVDFYFNALNVLSVTQKIIVKALNNPLYATVVVTADSAMLGELDTYLWTFNSTSFIPHLLCTDLNHPAVNKTPVLLLPNLITPPQPPLNSSQLLPPDYDHLMINIGSTVPHYFTQFKRLIEIVGVDEPSKIKGRERFIFYKQRGYPMSHLDLIHHDT
jgi:DNA polymerase III subunit chi